MSNNILGEWERLSRTLDDDEMLIYPEMYLENEELFQDILGVGYLVKDLDHPERLDWVGERQLYRIFQKGINLAVISKLLIVKLRLPWNDVNHEWLCGQNELNANAEDYEVLDVYIWARHNGGPSKWIGPTQKQHFESHREEYEVVDIRYNVRWKWSRDEIDDLIASPLAGDECIAHAYVENLDFWERYYKEESEDVST